MINYDAKALAFVLCCKGKKKIKAISEIELHQSISFQIIIFFICT